VRRFLCDSALMWLRDYHFDGLRLDAVHAIYDQSATHFLEQLATEVELLEHQLGRPLVLIAESDLNDPRLIRPRAAGGYGLHAQWSDDFHHALHAVLTGDRAGYYCDFGALADLAKALRQAYVLDGYYSAFRRRRHGRPPGRLSGHRFLGYLQNHDQVGNRPAGERSSRLMGVGRLKIGAAIVLTSPFVPMLFAGEEWGAESPFYYFIEHDDPNLAQAVARGRKREFAAHGWDATDAPDPQSPQTFMRSKLDWNEPSRSPHAELLDWHRQLIRLRRQTPDLTDGRLDRVKVAFDETQRWLRIDRGSVTIACNLSTAAQRFDVGQAKPVLVSDETVELSENQVVLPPDAVAILIAE